MWHPTHRRLTQAKPVTKSYEKRCQSNSLKQGQVRRFGRFPVETDSPVRTSRECEGGRGCRGSQTPDTANRRQRSQADGLRDSACVAASNQIPATSKADDRVGAPLITQDDLCRSSMSQTTDFAGLSPWPTGCRSDPSPIGSESTRKCPWYAPSETTSTKQTRNSGHQTSQTLQNDAIQAARPSRRHLAVICPQESAAAGRCGDHFRCCCCSSFSRTCLRRWNNTHAVTVLNPSLRETLRKASRSSSDSIRSVSVTRSGFFRFFAMIA